MSIRRSISTKNKLVNDVLDEKAQDNKASAFIEESILFYLKYKDQIDCILSFNNMMEIMKGGGVLAVQPVITEKKKQRAKSLVK